MAKTKLDPEKFCPIPFLQLQLNPRGNVSACCFSGEHKVGNVAESSLKEIWNNAEMRKWRREFMTGDIEICANAMKTFGCHRNYAYLTPKITLAEVQDGMPRKLDLRLNGKCNLECIMCDVWREPNHLYDECDFWTDGPTKIFPYLLEIEMLGGEPFIQKDTFRFIDEVCKVNKTVTWGFITNCQYKFTEQLQSYLDKIRLRSLHMSLDSVNPETYAKIRLKGDLKKTLSTVQSYMRYRDLRKLSGQRMQLFASMCVQRANWREIPEFLAFCDERDVQPVLQNVIGRDHLSLRTLERSEREGIIEFLSPLLAGKHQGGVRFVIDEVRGSL
ncbi:MAG: SPASM domain-containing protein [Deltaproteobacteria bacterium]|nr:SPASM domain-containing protein [Deltaproteobacteria bacterium]